MLLGTAVQGGIYNPVKHLWWSFLGKQLTVCLDYFRTFVQNTFLDVLSGPKHAFAYFRWKEKIWDWNMRENMRLKFRHNPLVDRRHKRLKGTLMQILKSPYNFVFI